MMSEKQTLSVLHVKSDAFASAFVFDKSVNVNNANEWHISTNHCKMCHYLKNLTAQQQMNNPYLLRHTMNDLQEKPVGELGEIFSEVSDVLEAAAAMGDPLKGRSHVIQELEQLRERIKIPASNGRKSDGKWTGFNKEHVCADRRTVMTLELMVLSLVCFS